MIVEQAQIINFKNLQEIQIEFSPKLNLILGQNGQGKTNLLEALYISLTGSAFRQGDNETLLRYEQTYAHTKVLVMQKELDLQISFRIQEDEKQHFLNEKKISKILLRQRFPIVLFSPDSLASIKESDEQRRLLIDEVILQIETQATEIYSELKHSHKQRNRILKNFKEEKSTEKETLELLEGMDQIFLPLSAKWAALRLKTCQEVLPYLNSALHYISDEAIDLRVEYLISKTSALGKSEDEILQILRKRRTELASAELASGTSLVGTHKHEISFLWNGHDSRFFCSQGQQRAIILAFKIAQIRYHQKVHKSDPFLMLDDILSEIDEKKRLKLIQLLQEFQSQTFLTSTEADLSNYFSGGKVFEMKKGQVFGAPN